MEGETTTTMTSAHDADEPIDADGTALTKWRERVAPDLSSHPCAVEVEAGGFRVFAASVGDVVVYNQYALSIPGAPWLKTVKGRVTAVDHVKQSVQVWDLDRAVFANASYAKPGPRGEEIRFPGRKANLKNVGKKRRGRPARERTAEELAKIADHAERKAKGLVKRGRPKGALKRPQDVIDAEKRLKEQKRREKAAKREARRK